MDSVYMKSTLIESTTKFWIFATWGKNGLDWYEGVVWNGLIVDPAATLIAGKVDVLTANGP